jgi:hypothetical protein
MELLPPSSSWDFLRGELGGSFRLRPVAHWGRFILQMDEETDVARKTFESVIAELPREIMR